MNKTLLGIVAIVSLAVVICFNIYSNTNRYSLHKTSDIHAVWTLDEKTGETYLTVFGDGKVATTKAAMRDQFKK